MRFCGLDLAMLGLRLEALEQSNTLLLARRIAFRLAELDEGRGIVKIALETRQSTEPILELGAFAHDLLRGVRIVPEGRILGLGTQFGEAARRCLDVKDASSAVPWTA